MEPKTRYAKSGDVHIAYQLLGSGDRDLILVPGFISHVEHFWEDPGVARFLRRMASFARLIFFDKRGTGMSDRVPEPRGAVRFVGCRSDGHPVRRHLS
jgi:pimeloyl-ACP methyl ester carboxylesterase